MPSISPISVGVAQLLTNIQSQKTSGQDKLSARFLKEAANEIAHVLKVIFQLQASLDQGNLPDIFGKTAVLIVPRKLQC